MSGSTVACDVTGVSAALWRVFKLIGSFYFCKPRVRCYEMKSEFACVLESAIVVVQKEGYNTYLE